MSQLKLAVVGGGAIGGLLAARLARAGLQPSLLARGQHLAAIRSRGLEVIEAGQSYLSQLHASDKPAELGVQDIVFICLKGSALVEAAASLAPLIGPATRIMSVMNGVPWWFLHGRLWTPPAWYPRSCPRRNATAAWCIYHRGYARRA